MAGSGKSFTPLSRMHWANLRRASCCSGAPLRAREPRWLQVLTRADGLLERRAVRVQRRAVRTPSMVEVARRVRVRERADPVGAHALGELHRLLPSGGVLVARVLPAVPVRQVRSTQPAAIRATMARAASGRSVLLMCLSSRGACCGMQPWSTVRSYMTGDAVDHARRRPRDPPRSGCGRAGPTRPR